MPADRRTSDGGVASSHYTPYPPPSPSFQTPAIPQRPPAKSRGGSSREKKPAVPASPPISLTDFVDRDADRDDSPGNAAAGGGAHGGEYKVARAISSCTRCRTRKQKCDGKLPACSACERAKVECIGFDAISKTNVSRNHLHTLEQEVIQLRAQVAALQSGHPDASVFALANHPPVTLNSFSPSLPTPEPLNPTIDPSLTEIDPSLRSTFSPSTSRHGRRLSDFPFGSSGHGGERSPSLSSAMNPKNHSLTRMVHDAAFRTGHAMNQQNAISAFNAPGPVGSHHSDRGSVHSGHEGDVAPSPDRFHTASARTIPGGSRLGIGAASLEKVASSAKGKGRQFTIPPLPPQPAVERLVAAYVDFVGVTAPMVHIPTLGKQLVKIREGRDVEESDIFIVMMVLALSTMASARFIDPPDELRACSEAFHAEAMKHLDAVYDEGSYVGLQAILLLIWYSLLNPEKGSIWYLVGLATRTCVDMGYHNEHNAQIEQLDALEIDMRRRLFWCAYKMDRLLSQSLGRPPSIPDGFINVPMPSGLHDVDINSDHYGPPTGDVCGYKATFVHTVKIRQLQSEILAHTYGMHGRVNAPSPEWFDNCYERLKAWLADAPEPRGTMTAEGYAISFHNSALLLYRPSSGNPRPDRKALSTVLASSSYIIRIHRRMQLSNRISWLWMTSHFSFMAGLSFLYAFMNLHTQGGGEGVPTLEEAMMDIDACLSTLEYLSSRVPSAAACHDTMRTLSQSILEQLASPSALQSQASAGSLRHLSRIAPISSSRDDPLPNSDYLAPLPSVTLPYELSLLDNLFINPMATHAKASDYTNGSKSRAVPEARNSLSTLYSQAGNPNAAGSMSNGAPSYGTGVGAYNMAAQVKSGYTDCPSISQSLAALDPGSKRAQMARSTDSIHRPVQSSSGSEREPAKDSSSSALQATPSPSLLVIGTNTAPDVNAGTGAGAGAGAGAYQSGFSLDPSLDRSFMGNSDTMGDLGILLGAMDGHEEANQQFQTQQQAQTQSQSQSQGGEVNMGENALQGLGGDGLGLNGFDFFSFLDDGFPQDGGLDGMALWS